MSLIQEIFAWSKDLPPWQSDAVSRLLAKKTLDGPDVDDLCALLKAAHGIPDPANRIASPLTAAQVPAPVEAKTHVELHAIKNLKNVNAIAENQCVTFGKTGITVIYGDNGSGKSGYSRVLKRACRARDQSEPIYPNANLPAGKAGPPAATFDIAVDGNAKEVTWCDGKVPPPELSSLAIFDSYCARAYLDKEDDFSYVPYGLDIFQGLVNVFEQIKKAISTEHAALSVDLTAFAHLNGETTVGNLIAGLSAKTKPAQVEALATLTEAELAERETLEKSLKENNPKEKANVLRLRAKRIGVIAKNVVGMQALVSSEVVTNLKALADSYRTAKVAAELAAKQFKEDGNLLPGTGGDAWRQLFEAARAYSVEALPDRKFPDLGDAAPCPLCQQPLGDGAKRLLRFEAFIQADAEKTAQARRKALFALYKPLDAQVMTLGLDDVLNAEIAEIDAKLAEDTKEFEAILDARKLAILSSVVSHDWTAIKSPLAGPAERLQALANKLNVEADTLDKASNEAARVALQKRLAELDARARLAQVKEAVINAIAKMELQAKLNNCLPSLRTNSISLKASELAEKVVSKQLAEALNNEFKALGVGTLSVALQSRSGKGKTLHKLKLQLPQARNPAEILSEGEQRAIAIGSFLAEVGLSEGKGGIVFDDPVSSLDHRRRERVAQRLAKEAMKRQVIVLTHDIYFLCVLVEEAKRASVLITTQSLTRRSEGFGVADPELPFEGMNTSKRIGALKDQYQRIRKLYKDGEEQEHRRETIEAYYLLRMAWERAVEEVLFRSVILRFRKGVETQRLAGVSVTDDDFAKVTAGMAKCSNYAHDKALAGGIAVPDPDDLLADIQDLENWRAAVNKRAEDTSKQRKV